MKKITFLALIILFINTFSIFPTTNQIIHVGYYESNSLQIGNSEEIPKSGYAYEYLRKIASYTGWQYNYIYDNFENLSRMIENCEIDLIVAKENDKIFKNKNIEHSKFALLVAKVKIYKKSGDSKIKSGYISSLHEKKIGVVKNTIYSEKLKDFVKEYEIPCEIKEFNTKVELNYALRDGRINFLVTSENDSIDFDKLSPVYTIGEESYFFCVSKKQQEILNSLNDAMISINNDYPYFDKELRTEYYEKYSFLVGYSDMEIAWFKTHKSLKVGYLEDYMPYSFFNKETQKISGLIGDIIKKLQKEAIEFGISIETKNYSNMRELLLGLKHREIDVIFPIYNDEWYSEINEIRISSPITSQNLILLFKDSYSENVLKSIAVSESSPIQDAFITIKFPESKKKIFKTLEDCVYAILEGDVNSTVVNRYKADKFISKFGRRHLSFLTLNDDCKLCFAVRNEDIELLSIINHLRQNLDEDELNFLLRSYSFSERDYSLREVVETNIFLFITLFILIISLILLGFFLYIHSTLRRRRELEKSQKALSFAKTQVEEALESAQKANKAKSIFLFNMSHDIRTPMNAIIGFAELLERHKANQEKSDEYISNIKKSGKYLLDLINEVLEMARIENGKVSLDETVVNLSDIINDLRIVVEKSYKDKNLSVTKNFNVIHNSVFCDQVKVKEILMNIMSNAIKYSKQGGKIEALHNEIESPEKDKMIFEVKIKDNGIGMSQEFIPHIFDSFSREKNATESKIVGTGLGMGIVKKYVDLMNGVIEVESELGKGTCVTVRFSFRIADFDGVFEKISVPVEPIKFEGMRILLAEDNELNQEIAVEILTEFGFKVEKACDGVECLSLISQKDESYYDLILMDVQMPNINGYEATKTIRSFENPKKSTIPIIAMTANVFEEDKKKAFESGMDGFIGKPIDVKKLIAEISKIKNLKK